MNDMTHLVPWRKDCARISTSCQFEFESWKMDDPGLNLLPWALWGIYAGTLQFYWAVGPKNTLLGGKCVRRPNTRNSVRPGVLGTRTGRYNLDLAKNPCISHPKSSFLLVLWSQARSATQVFPEQGDWIVGRRFPNGWSHASTTLRIRRGGGRYGRKIRWAQKIRKFW